MEHLTTRNGVLYWRRRVPKDIEERCGRSYLWKSLKSKDRRATKPLARHLSAAVDRAFKIVRDNPALSSADIDRILKGYLDGALKDYTQQLSAKGWRPVEEQEREREAIDIEWGELADSFRFFDDTEAVESIADNLIGKHGLPIGRGSEEYRSFCRRLMMAQLDLLKLKGEQLENFYGPLVAAGNPAAQAEAPQLETAPTLSVASEKYISASSPGWTVKTTDQTTQTFKLFSQHLEGRGGDKMVTAITRQDCATFREALGQLPVNYGKSPKDRDVTLQELIRRDGDKLKPKTVKRHMTVLTSFFSWLKVEGVREGDNPASGFKYARSKRAREDREAWTYDELAKLFASPVWQGRKSKHYAAQPGALIIRDALYWVPLMALYHGMRLEEAAQLRTEDVQETNGIWHFNLHTGEGYQLKNRNAIRRLPVHSELIRLGLPEFLKGKAPKDLLFPELKQGGPDMRYGFYLTKKFGNYRHAVGLKREGVGIHSMRSNFTTALQNAEVPESTANELLGHGGATISYDRYGKGLDLTVLKEAIEKVRYPGIAL